MYKKAIADWKSFTEPTMIVLILLLLLLPSVRLQDSGYMRLVGGPSRCEGKLQVKHLNKWQYSVFSVFFLKTAAAVCERLRCGSVVSHIKRTSISDHLAVQLNSICVRSWSPIRFCVNAVDEPTKDYYGVTCSDTMKLISGPRMCSGSLLVYLDQTTSLVCEDDFDLKDAEVACRELGCGDPKVLQGAPHQSLQVQRRWTFQCEGHESVLRNCSRFSQAETSCPSGKSVMLICSEPIRLVAGSSDCDGTVQLRHRGQWKPLWAQLDEVSVAKTVCPLLDCGSAVSDDYIDFFLAEPVWKVLSLCTELSHDLRQCVIPKFIKSENAVKVECSGRTNLLDLLWLIPAFMVIIVAVTLLIICQRKKSSLNAPKTKENSKPSNPENLMSDNTSVNEGSIYQSLGTGTRDQVYLQLHPQPPNST